jgi:glutathione S-transferase
LPAELQGGNQDQVTMVNSVMPLERALLAQTYLVQDTLSLADIVIALDIKHMVGTITTVQFSSFSTLYWLALLAHSAKLQAHLQFVRLQQHIHTSTHS